MRFAIAAFFMSLSRVSADVIPLLPADLRTPAGFISEIQHVPVENIGAWVRGIRKGSILKSPLFSKATFEQKNDAAFHTAVFFVGRLGNRQNDPGWTREAGDLALTHIRYYMDWATEQLELLSGTAKPFAPPVIGSDPKELASMKNTLNARLGHSLCYKFDAYRALGQVPKALDVFTSAPISMLPTRARKRWLAALCDPLPSESEPPSIETAISKRRNFGAWEKYLRFLNTLAKRAENDDLLDIQDEIQTVNDALRAAKGTSKNVLRGKLNAVAKK